MREGLDEIVDGERSVGHLAAVALGAHSGAGHRGGPDRGDRGSQHEPDGRLGPDHARSEVRRYITLPGQATGYKIGMLKIMELRRKAEQQLGAKFDIKSFHKRALDLGGVGLDTLRTALLKK